MIPATAAKAMDDFYSQRESMNHSWSLQSQKVWVGPTIRFVSEGSTRQASSRCSTSKRSPKFNPQALPIGNFIRQSALTAIDDNDLRNILIRGVVRDFRTIG